MKKIFLILLLGIASSCIFPVVFELAYFSDPQLTKPLGNHPCLKEGTYFLKITADKALLNPPQISIDAEGTANDLTDAITFQINEATFCFTRQIFPDPQAPGTEPENYLVNGMHPANADAMAAFTDTEIPLVEAGPDISWTRVKRFLNPTVTDTSEQLTYFWEKIRGEGTVLFSGQTEKNPEIQGLAGEEQSFLIRLTVTDPAGNSACDRLTFHWDYKAPLIETEDTVCWNDTPLVLKPLVSDLTSLSYQWEKLLGPATIFISSPRSGVTTVSGKLGNTESCTIRLRVTDLTGNHSYASLSFFRQEDTPQPAEGSVFPWSREVVDLEAATLGFQL